LHDPVTPINLIKLIKPNGRRTPYLRLPLMSSVSAVGSRAGVESLSWCHRWSDVGQRSPA